jgi:ribosomal protein S18 acetylase RimI-like enzyme
MLQSSKANHISLRSITEADSELLYDIYASARRAALSGNGWDPERVEVFLRQSYEAQRDFYRTRFPYADCQMVLANGRPAGRLYVQHSETDIRIMEFALLPAFRGQGIGRALLQDLIADADALRLPLRLHVELSNPIRLRFLSLGFRQEPLDGTYVFMERPVPARTAK